MILFAQILRSELARLGFTQQDAANLLDTSKSNIEKWSRLPKPGEDPKKIGARTPHILTQEGALDRLAKATPKR